MKNKKRTDFIVSCVLLSCYSEATHNHLVIPRIGQGACGLIKVKEVCVALLNSLVSVLLEPPPSSPPSKLLCSRHI